MSLLCDHNVHAVDDEWCAKAPGPDHKPGASRIPTSTLSTVFNLIDVEGMGVLHPFYFVLGCATALFALRPQVYKHTVFKILGDSSAVRRRKRNVSADRLDGTIKFARRQEMQPFADLSTTPVCCVVHLLDTQTSSASTDLQFFVEVAVRHL